MSNSIGSWYRIVPDCFKYRINYIDFVKQIIEDQPLTKLQKLENNREALKTLFKCWPFIIDGLLEDFRYWSSYVDTAVYIVSHADNEIITNIHWENIYNSSVLPVTYIKILFALLLPNELVKDTFHKYIDSFENIISYNSAYWKERLDTGIEEFNGILNYLYDLSQEIPFNTLRSNLKTQAFIIAYIYLNNIKNYNIIKDFILNEEYYIEKMKINDCYIINETGLYDYDKAQKVFNNFDSIFGKNKVLIK